MLYASIVIVDAVVDCEVQLIDDYISAALANKLTIYAH